MNYLLLAYVVTTLAFIIVIARLITEIHKLHVKIERLNEYNRESMDVIRDYIIQTKNKIEVIASVADYRFSQLDSMDQYIRKELMGELIAIGKTTSAQADIMLKIEEKINELERPDEKEGDVIESERIPAACIEN